MLWLRASLFTYGELWSQVDFSLNLAFEVVAAPGWSYENISLTQSEVWLLRAGRCLVQSGERKGLAQAGDVVILREDEYRLTSNCDHAPLDIIGFGCTARLLGAVDFVSLLDPPLCFRNESSLLPALLQSVVNESSERRPGHHLAAVGHAQLALVEVLRAGGRVLAGDTAQSDTAQSDAAQGDAAPDHSLEQRALGRLQAAQNGDIALALKLVAARFHEPLDVARLAQTAHLSPAHFARKFKATLGITPMEYLRDFRLRQARSLLAQCDDSIAHIAARCGFDDAAHFSRAFKKRFGSSPLEFRRYLRALSK